MERNTAIIIAIVIIAVVIVGAFAAMNMTPQQTTQISATGTKAAFKNNGTSWIHFFAVFENVTMKNGTVSNIYADVWLRDNGGIATVDLSNLAGYGDEPLPPGTTISIKAWKNVLRPQAGGLDDLRLHMQGWSNGQTPPTNDTPFLAEFKGLTIIQLPPEITDNQINTTFDSAEAATWLAAISNADGTMIYEEEIFTVNADGTVTITAVQPPVLCNLIAGIP
ncbi:MAG: hypothetical protein ACP5C3_00010 [Methanomicrobiales archaeon]